MNEIKILIACGSGIATSTVVQEKVKVILKDANIRANIIKGTVSEIPSKSQNVDLVLVTTNYRKAIDVPLIPVFGLISGINEDKIAQDIIDTSHKIMKGEI